MAAKKKAEPKEKKMSKAEAKKLAQEICEELDTDFSEDKGPIWRLLCRLEKLVEISKLYPEIIEEIVPAEGPWNEENDFQYFIDDMHEYADNCSSLWGELTELDLKSREEDED